MSEKSNPQPVSSTEAELRVAAATTAGTLADFEPQDEAETAALLAALRRRERLWQERAHKMRKVVYGRGYDIVYDKYWKNGNENAAEDSWSEIAEMMVEVAAGTFDTPEEPEDEFLAEKLRDTEPTEEEVQAYNRRD